MGIHGIYKEIGPGQRIALSKLAVQKYEETGRPLRIAIDVSIWLFQIQASKGGTNPALRTFYYRLLRLIALSIHPIFVFDGPNKPPFKRNKRTGPNVASIPEFLAKQLLKQFGFSIHLAPGEAEAECALLQQEGIADAVLSEDVDTLMFGSGMTLRNWSPEMSTGKKPTHVNVYDAIETKNGPSGLDREGMILVALMSGGDYVPEGIPGCGPKTACEAARAGFGRDLCKIRKGDQEALREWRERLQHELKTNESRFFKRKHRTLVIPENFPRTDILGYYTHPAISTSGALDKLRRSIKLDQDLDFPGLRTFTADAFDWVKLGGAKHFIRTLAPALLVRRLRMRGDGDSINSHEHDVIQQEEDRLVKSIHGQRQHAETDSSIELRIAFTPIDFVTIDLEQEEPDDEQLEPNSDDDELPLDIDGGEIDAPKKRTPTQFDPYKPQRVWVMETFVKVGVPLKVQDWEEGLRRKELAAAAKAVKTSQRASKPAPKPKTGARRGDLCTGMPTGALDRYAKVTKPNIRTRKPLGRAEAQKTALRQETSQSPPRSLDVSSQALGASTSTAISLLSSSPSKPSKNTLSTCKNNHLPSVEENVPICTTRSKRGPLQRARTLPTAPTDSEDRPLTPPPQSPIDTLDLVSSPAVPARLQGSPNKNMTGLMPTKQTNKKRSKVSTPSSAKFKQTTLDSLSCSSPAVTPAKAQHVNTSSRATSTSLPPESQLNEDGWDVLDMTLASPQIPITQPIIIATNNRRAKSRNTRARNPLQSINSNASPSSIAPDSNHLNTKAVSRTPRRSPRIRNSKSKSKSRSRSRSKTPETDTIDLTQVSSSRQPENSLPSPGHPGLSPSIETQARHRALLNNSATPTAAWKDRAKKKREIILRKSLAGAWDYRDEDSPTTRNESHRRKWRESQVDFLDLS